MGHALPIAPWNVEERISRIRDGLYVGNRDAGTDATLLRALRLDAVLCVAFDIEFACTPAIAFLRLPLIDGPGNSPFAIELAVREVAIRRQLGQRHLVYCHSGRNRSPYVVARALARMEGRPMYAVWREMTEARPCIDSRRRLEASYGSDGTPGIHRDNSPTPPPRLRLPPPIRLVCPSCK